MTLAAADTDTLALHGLDFEPDPECDFSLVECHQVVTWRVTCRVCEGWSLVCTEHMRALLAAQHDADRRSGQRCNACEAVGFALQVFHPIISADLGTLW